VVVAASSSAAPTTANVRRRVSDFMLVLPKENDIQLHRRAALIDMNQAKASCRYFAGQR
jgi:hypothetical protein